MTKEQLLRWDGTGRVDHDLFASIMTCPKKGRDIREERRLDFARLITLPPEIALQTLEVRYFNIASHQISNMRL
jgi:hypothetical protein